MNKGRPLDQIWTQFEKTNTGKAKCKDCGCEFAALVERKKTHYSKFHAKTAQDDATAPKQRKMEPFVNQIKVLFRNKVFESSNVF